MNSETIILYIDDDGDFTWREPWDDTWRDIGELDPKWFAIICEAVKREASRRARLTNNGDGK